MLIARCDLTKLDAHKNLNEEQEWKATKHIYPCLRIPWLVREPSVVTNKSSLPSLYCHVYVSHLLTYK